MEQPQIARLRLGRSRLVYERWGSGPPLLLVHGLSGSTRWWRRNIPALAPHFTVYAIDLVGFGRNRAWQPLGLAATAETLATFLQAVAAGPAHVIGHSMGGQIAIHLAARHPALVDHLVLVAASGLVRASVLRMATRLPQVARATAPGFRGTLLADAARAGSLNVLRSARALLHDDVTVLLPTITTPTLVISGQYDHLIPPELGAAQQRAIPNAEYTVLAGAGHIVMWDCPADFNARVLRFLRPAPPA